MLQYTPEHSLTLTHATFGAIAIQLQGRGTHCFSAWGTVDSGETAPLWAEPDLELILFGPTDAPMRCRVEYSGNEWFRARDENSRAAATLDVRLEDEEVRRTLEVVNSQPCGGRMLPLGAVELRFENIAPGPDARGESAKFWSTLPCGGRTFPHGRVADLQAPGVDFAQGVIGLQLPLVYLHVS